MKAILLAAGRSFRMAPIGDKNFLQFCGMPLVARQIEMLKSAGVKELALIGGAHNLQELRELNISGIKLHVLEQKNLDEGMAGAVLAAEKFIGNDPFLVVSANDVLDASAFKIISARAKMGNGLLLAKKVTSYFPGGYLELGRNGRITKIVEKPGEGNEPSDLVNIVVHYHPKPGLLVEALKNISSDRDDRYERALQALLDSGKIAYDAVPFDGFWQPVKYPWHVLDLMEYFLQTVPAQSSAQRKSKKVEIAATAVIGKNVYLDDGVRVLDNAVIQGPAYLGKNTIVATGALVRGSHIGDNCVIGFGSEIARSYVGNEVWTHANYIGDSIIGNNVSFGSGTVTGNLRLDEKSIAVVIKNAKSPHGEKITSSRTKLGLITGDHIRVGINTSFMPGIKIGSNSAIGAGITIAQDIPENSFVAGEWKLKIKPNRERISSRKPSG